jgi:uncharacterized membrane protein YkvA (DUF1232 family)
MRRLLRLWRLARGDLGLLWFALRHRRRPAWLWPVAGFLALYALDPFNFVMPAIGVVDDLVILPIALHLLVKLLPPEIHASFARRAHFTVS